MTFGELQTVVYEMCGYPPPVQPIVVSRVKSWINQAHRYCLRLPGLLELRQKSGLPFVTVIGLPIYAMPYAYERIDAVVERTSDRRLIYMSRDILRSADPAERSVGTPTAYIPEGWQPRYRLPNYPASLYVFSMNDTDRTQIVRLTGITSDVEATASVMLTGSTPVQIGTITDYSDVVAWSLSSSCAGDVVLSDAAVHTGDADTLARIVAGQTSTRYWCMRLWPTPSAVVTYYVDGQIEIPDLVYETDTPMLPSSFHDLLSAFARMREYERNGDNRYALAAAEVERGVGHLRASVNYPDDYKPVAGKWSHGVPRTNLGGYFPADDWSPY